MQKACGIIAIGAIALGTASFASAQTSDRSAPTADPSSALRAQVMNTLQQAGFTNIRIVSESFLVHAIDQNGNPVVMLIRPDSQPVMPEMSEDQDEASAAEPRYPDSLTDLAEDEDEATAPAPRSSRIGKSSRMTDGSPNSGTQEQTKIEQAPNRPIGDGGPSQSADNQKFPGRPDGMMQGTKEAEPGALNLTAAQRAEIWQRLGNQQATAAPPGFQPKVGATVPPSMPLKSLPSSVSSQVPQVQSYDYGMVQNGLLIVDPATKKIVSIITE